MKTPFLLDDDGQRTYAGDTICFTYGIPTVPVRAKVVLRQGKLIALTPFHIPTECNLRSLRRYVGGWYRRNAPAEKGGEG